MERTSATNVLSSSVAQQVLLVLLVMCSVCTQPTSAAPTIRRAVWGMVLPIGQQQQSNADKDGPTEPAAAPGAVNGERLPGESNISFDLRRLNNITYLQLRAGILAAFHHHNTDPHDVQEINMEVHLIEQNVTATKFVGDYGNDADESWQYTAVDPEALHMAALEKFKREDDDADDKKGGGPDDDVVFLGFVGQGSLGLLEVLEYCVKNNMTVVGGRGGSSSSGSTSTGTVSSPSVPNSTTTTTTTDPNRLATLLASPTMALSSFSNVPEMAHMLHYMLHSHLRCRTFALVTSKEETTDVKAFTEALQDLGFHDSTQWTLAADGNYSYVPASVHVATLNKTLLYSDPFADTTTSTGSATDAPSQSSSPSPSTTSPSNGSSPTYPQRTTPPTARKEPSWWTPLTASGIQSAQCMIVIDDIAVVNAVTVVMYKLIGSTNKMAIFTHNAGMATPPSWFYNHGDETTPDGFLEYFTNSYRTEQLPNPHDISYNLVKNYQLSMKQLYDSGFRPYDVDAAAESDEMSTTNNMWEGWDQPNYAALHGYVLGRAILSILHRLPELTGKEFQEELYHSTLLPIDDILLGPLSSGCSGMMLKYSPLPCQCNKAPRATYLAKMNATRTFSASNGSSSVSGSVALLPVADDAARGEQEVAVRPVPLSQCEPTLAEVKSPFLVLYLKNPALATLKVPAESLYRSDFSTALRKLSAWSSSSATEDSPSDITAASNAVALDTVKLSSSNNASDIVSVVRSLKPHLVLGHEDTISPQGTFGSSTTMAMGWYTPKFNIADPPASPTNKIALDPVMADFVHALALALCEVEKDDSDTREFSKTLTIVVDPTNSANTSALPGDEQLVTFIDKSLRTYGLIEQGGPFGSGSTDGTVVYSSNIEQVKSAMQSAVKLSVSKKKTHVIILATQDSAAIATALMIHANNDDGSGDDNARSVQKNHRENMIVGIAAKEEIVVAAVKAVEHASYQLTRASYAYWSSWRERCRFDATGDELRHLCSVWFVTSLPPWWKDMRAATSYANVISTIAMKVESVQRFQQVVGAVFPSRVVSRIGVNSSSAQQSSIQNSFASPRMFRTVHHAAQIHNLGSQTSGKALQEVQFVSSMFSGSTWSAFGQQIGPFSLNKCAEGQSRLTTLCECSKGPRKFFVYSVGDLFDTTPGTFGNQLPYPLSFLQLTSCGVNYIDPTPTGSNADESASESMLTTTEAATVSVGGAISIGVVAAIVILCLVSRKRNNFYAPKNSNEPTVLCFTDIESSTSLWSLAPDAMSVAVADHHRVMRKLIRSHHGYEVKTIGDSFMVAFSNPHDAVKFAADAQVELMSASSEEILTKIDDVYVQLKKEKVVEDEVAEQLNNFMQQQQMQSVTSAITSTAAADATKEEGHHRSREENNSKSLSRHEDEVERFSQTEQQEDSHDEDHVVEGMNTTQPPSQLPATTTTRNNQDYDEAALAPVPSAFGSRIQRKRTANPLERRVSDGPSSPTIALTAKPPAMLGAVQDLSTSQLEEATMGSNKSGPHSKANSVSSATVGTGPTSTAVFAASGSNATTGTGKQSHPMSPLLGRTGGLPIGFIPMGQPERSGSPGGAGGPSGAMASHAMMPPMEQLESLIDDVKLNKREVDTSMWHGLRVRIGLHMGFAEVHYDQITLGYDYYGTVVNTAARVEAAGHGGQVIVTHAVVEAIRKIVHVFTPSSSKKKNKNKNNKKQEEEEEVEEGNDAAEQQNEASPKSPHQPGNADDEADDDELLLAEKEFRCERLGKYPLRGLQEPVSLYTLTMNDMDDLKTSANSSASDFSSQTTNSSSSDWSGRGGVNGRVFPPPRIDVAVSDDDEEEDDEGEPHNNELSKSTQGERDGGDGAGGQATLRSGQQRLSFTFGSPSSGYGSASYKTSKSGGGGGNAANLDQTAKSTTVGGSNSIGGVLSAFTSGQFTEGSDGPANAGDDSGTAGSSTTSSAGISGPRGSAGPTGHNGRLFHKVGHGGGGGDINAIVGDEEIVRQIRKHGVTAPNLIDQAVGNYFFLKVLLSALKESGRKDFMDSVDRRWSIGLQKVFAVAKSKKDRHDAEQQELMDMSFSASISAADQQHHARGGKSQQPPPKSGYEMALASIVGKVYPVSRIQQERSVRGYKTSQQQQQRGRLQKRNQQVVMDDAF